MKNLNLPVYLFLIAALFTAGCQNGATATSTNSVTANTGAVKSVTDVTPTDQKSAPDDDAPRVTLADAKSAFDAGEALFVDTRGEAAYKSEHIEGALNITKDNLESKLSSLPKNKKLIAYCS